MPKGATCAQDSVFCACSTWNQRAIAADFVSNGRSDPDRCGVRSRGVSGGAYFTRLVHADMLCERPLWRAPLELMGIAPVLVLTWCSRYSDAAFSEGICIVWHSGAYLDSSDLF